MPSISVSISQSCTGGSGQFVVSVGMPSAQNIYVTFTGASSGLVSSAVISGVTNYVFTQSGLANDTYTILAHGSLSGNSASFQRTISCAGTPNGYKAFRNLEQYYTDNNQPTGASKPNVSTDPNYIAHSLDSTCNASGGDWQPIYTLSGTQRGCFTEMMKYVGTGSPQADRAATELEYNLYFVQYGSNGQLCLV